MREGVARERADKSNGLPADGRAATRPDARAIDKENVMAKKGLLALALAAFVAGGAFAQLQVPPLQFSAGGGFVFDGGRVGGESFSESDFSIISRLNHTGFGGFVFLDVTFAELSIAFMGGPAQESAEMSGGGLSVNASRTGSFTALDFSLVGKFPFALGGGNFTVFPMLGFGYNLVLSSNDEDGNDRFERMDNHSATDLSTFRITLGGGADFDINPNLFFRTSVLGYYRFAPSYFRDLANEASEHGVNVSSHGGFGATVRLAVGVRF